MQNSSAMPPTDPNACLHAVFAVMRGSSDGYCAIDDEMRVLAINPVLRRYLSLSAEDGDGSPSLFALANGRLDVSEMRAFLAGAMAHPLDLNLAGEPRFVARVSAQRTNVVDRVTFRQFRFQTDHSRHLARKRNEIRELACEIRTPLTSVYGFSELLLSREFPAEKQREFIELIYEEAGRLARHVEQLLHLELDVVDGDGDGEAS
ncbi:MAG: hypothetical protein GC159_22870 [Phycisphaera sp.]|nr:hypothetical protein [Phycisphaera sp.]